MDNKVNQYAKVALLAYKNLSEKKHDCSIKAWESALLSENVKDKVCPRNAFIGLSEMGLLKNCFGPKKRLNQESNKYYAITAVKILLISGPISKNELIARMKQKTRLDKSQFSSISDVVLALWDKNHIEKEIDLTEEIEKLRKKKNPTVNDILGDLDI